MEEQPQNIETLLKKAGFLDKEITVYLTILKMGRGLVSEISRKAGINRTTGYVILDSLANKGLISISSKEPKQEFVAESPEKLVEYFKLETEKQRSINEELKNILPEISLLYNKGDRPKLKFYEGLDGLKQVYEDTLTSTEPIVAYATYDDMHKTLPNYFPSYYKRRAEKGIFIRGIVPATPLAYERKKENINEARDFVLIPANKYLFSPEIDIYDNKTMIASWREKLGIIIESAEIADAMKKIFELAWIGAKQVEKELNIK